MTLQVTCLGGAAAWPNPGQGCSSFLLTAASTTLLIDCGPNTLLELRKHTLYSQIDGIIVSHCHSDHILDLVPYRYGLTYGVERPDVPIPLYMPPGGKGTLNGLAQVLGGNGESSDAFWESAFSIQEYDPQTAIQVGDIEVTFQQTVHAAECYAMRIEHQSRSVVYSADTGDFAPLVPFASGCDLLISEATLLEDDTSETAGHLRPSEAGKFAAQSGTGQLVLTHLWSEREDAEVIDSVRTYFDGSIDTAKPGRSFDV
jgi:ribonuclease BN (tRNA processing enzyme)